MSIMLWSKSEATDLARELDAAIGEVAKRYGFTWMVDDLMRLLAVEDRRPKQLYVLCALDSGDNGWSIIGIFDDPAPADAYVRAHPEQGSTYYELDEDFKLNEVAELWRR